MSNKIKTLEIDGYKVDIFHDDDAESPRTWDNLGTLIYNHPNYKLGEVKYDHDRVSNWNERLAYYIYENYLHCAIPQKYNRMDWGLDCDSLNEEGILFVRNWADKHMVILPVYLLDHSGLSVRTTQFTCRWDSGLVGYIIADRKAMQKEFSCKKLTETVKRKTKEILQAEIEVFDQYLSGDVYGYTITDSEGNDVNSCTGLFGMSYVMGEVICLINFHKMLKSDNKN